MNNFNQNEDNMENSINPMTHIEADIKAYVEAANVLAGKLSRFTPTDPQLCDIQRRILRMLDSAATDSMLIAITYAALSMKKEDR